MGGITNDSENKRVFYMGIDELGRPTLNLSPNGWIMSLLSTVGYYTRRLFMSKEAKDKEHQTMTQFASFLMRLRVQIKFDTLTGMPFVSLVDDKPPRRKRRDAAISCCYYEGESSKMKHKEPVVVENRHGNIIYNIYNLTVNIQADVVSQLITNPEKVVTIIQDQLQAEIEKQLKPEKEK